MHYQVVYTLAPLILSIVSALASQILCNIKYLCKYHVVSTIITSTQNMFYCHRGDKLLCDYNKVADPDPGFDNAWIRVWLFQKIGSISKKLNLKHL